MIHPIPAFADNYIWILINNDSTHAWVVDPGDAKPVKDYLVEHNLQLAGILITHHHNDHTGGVKVLRDEFECPVIGPEHLKDLVTQAAYDNDRITIFSSEFKVISTPGHTLDHLCYFAEDWNNAPILFSGDTLFRGGCGRLFEGTPKQMQHSLQKLSALPPETDIYCTHEYTQANYLFALAMEPNNIKLQENNKKVTELRDKQKPSLPTKIHIEQETNPFLRPNVSEIHTNAALFLQQPIGQDTYENFANIRKAKDSF